MKYLPILGTKTPSDLTEEVEKGVLTKIKVRDIIKDIEINPPGRKTYLTKDEEALIIIKAEMEGSHSVGVTRSHLGEHL